MSGAKLEVVRAWFKKADNDLLTAEHTMTLEHPPCDTVCFHTQQCAEKYLKGFLTFHEKEFPKTHSIEDLVQLCKDITRSFAEELSDVETLSAYGVEVRYPDEVYYEIPREDAVEAIVLAKKVKATVLRKLYENGFSL